MDLSLILVVMLGACGLGLVAGWIGWGRSAAALKSERDDYREKFGRAIVDLNVALTEAKQLDPLRTELQAIRTRSDEAERKVAALTAGQAERDKSFEAQLRQLNEAKEALSAQFSEVGQKLLNEAQTKFLERADQRFKEAGNESEAKIKAVLAPVEVQLKRYEEGVAKVEDERKREQGNLTGLIESMRVGQEAVRSEAAKLVNSLRSAPKARGRWGEQQLRNVLETCGLSEHADFSTEVSVDSEDGRLRPDAIIRVPGGRALVIDAKVSLNAYQDAFGAVEEGERHIGLAAHAASMRAHVNGLGNKAYWSQFADAPDYVIMFVPGEHFLSAALEHDPTLWDFAFEKRVLLATPTNLIAIARTVAAVWRQERLASEAKKIGALGKQMYDRLAVAAGHLKTVGTGLTTAVNNYNKFVSSFETRVLVTGREFRDLNIETGAKEIEELQPVEALARYGDAELLALPGEGERQAAE
jgi:DNA recombination protein RmuC